MNIGSKYQYISDERLARYMQDTVIKYLKSLPDDASRFDKNYPKNILE